MKQKILSLITVFVFLLANAQSKNETVALNWIKDNTTKLEIQSNHEFKMLFNRKGLSGETLRYYQTLNGVEVYDASIAIHISNNGIVTYHASTYDKTVSSINTTPNITSEQALEKTKLALNIKGEITYKESKLYVYNKLENTKLVYRFVTRSDKLTGAWETIVDAHTGNVLSTKDVAIYHKEKPKKKKDTKEKKDKVISAKNVAGVVNGTAMVFDTDPLTATLSTYGGSYVDNNDATNTALDNARSSVTLLDIELLGGTYRLRGPYVEIAELEAPATGLFLQNSPNFNFTRDQQGFEAANCYYHLDKSLRYINQTLGITLVSLFNGGVLRYDPHGVNGSDNSYYTAGTLTFGEGGVDDAEDADVVLHELGHGLHHWVTNGGLSQVNGLSEGSGDYWANSYKRSLGQWSTATPPASYVFGWDGHNPFWGGRTTSYAATYPGGLVNQIHTDGQIWASVLMEIWEIVGKEKTDKAFLEGLGMTNSNTNQQNAAIAVRQAAIDMAYTCAEIDAFTARFQARGYTLPLFVCNSASVNGFELNNISIFPNPSSNSISLSNITKDYNVAIYNVIGQKVITQSISSANTSIDVSNLSSGVYTLKFQNYKTSIKFVKQ